MRCSCSARLPSPAGQSSGGFSLEEVLSYPFPSDMTAAPRAPRIAWAVNERGQRNIWVAEGPSFTARQLTRYTVDDGQELTSIALTPSGDAVVYVRGGDHGANWDDSMPVNPLSTPIPPKVQVWSVPFAGGEPRLVGDGDFPAISPRGDAVAFERDKHIWVAPVDGSKPAARVVAANGSNGSATWSPDGSRLAFVSTAAITRSSASTSTSRRPSPGSRRRPRVTAHRAGRRTGSGSSSAAPRRGWSARAGARAAPRAVGAVDRRCRQRRGAPTVEATRDAARLLARRRWWREPAVGGPRSHRVRVVQVAVGRGSSLATGGDPLLLTPANAMVEHAQLSPNGASIVFEANTGPAADDIHWRHVMRVPVDRAAPELLTSGTGLEWNPVITAGAGEVASSAPRPSARRWPR